MAGKSGNWFWAAALVGLVGCKDDAPGAECSDAESCEQVDGDDGAGSSGSGGGATGDGSDGGSTAGEIPCDVQEVLAANCQMCHADPAQFGATMPLTTLEHFRVPSVSEPAVSVADKVLQRINDPDRPMPADLSMSDDDKAILAGWIEAGAPGDPDAIDCEGVSDGGDDPWGPDALPCEPTHTFLASSTDPDAGFEVPVVDDLYECFVFDSPFSADTQGIAWAPVIDDSRVVHHWLLLKAPADTPNGPAPCASSVGGLDTSMIMGWAPGTPNFVMPDEAGLELPDPGEKVMLQIHYNNSAKYTDVADKSGVALCTVEEPRKNAAGTLWLGSLQIDVPAGGTQEVVSDCNTTRLDEPVHILLDWPHMHEVGSAIKTELLRDGGGTPEMLAEVPNWNFNNQIYYPHEPSVTVNPGDVLRTTCNYTNDTGAPVTFGEGTGDEMCFDFAMVYPITAFDVTNPYGPPTLGRYCVDLGSDLPFP